MLDAQIEMIDGRQPAVRLGQSLGFDGRYLSNALLPVS